MTIKNRGGVFGRNPTFNNVDVDGTLSIAGAAVPAPANTLTTSDIGSTVQAHDADTAKLDVAQTFTQNQVFNGTIGVGTSAPSKKFVVSNSGQAGIEIDPFTRSATEGTSLLSYNRNTSAFVRADYDALYHIFWVSTSEKARITSDGITFNGDTAAANALDDYEEGTWTPTASSGLGGAYGGSGKYTKVGRSVYCLGSLNVTDITADIVIDGLPFTSSGDRATTVTALLAGATATQNSFVDISATTFNIKRTGTYSGGAITIYFGCWYFV